MAAGKQTFFQVGIIVPDLDRAMEELGVALGVTWGTIGTPEVEGVVRRVAWSVEGPPHIELIEGRDGTRWACPGGPRLDHVGRWVSDIESAKHELAERGLPIETDGAELGWPFSYHEARHCGMRVELLDASRQEGFYAGIGRAVPDAPART